MGVPRTAGSPTILLSGWSNTAKDAVRGEPSTPVPGDSAIRHHSAWCNGFANRSQCLSFEWRLRRILLVALSCTNRRCEQLVRTLQNRKWWVQHPPRPTHIRIEWLHVSAPPLLLVDHAVGNDLFAVTIDSHPSETCVTTKQDVGCESHKVQ